MKKLAVLLSSIMLIAAQPAQAGFLYKRGTVDRTPRRKDITNTVQIVNECHKTIVMHYMQYDSLRDNWIQRGPAYIRGNSTSARNQVVTGAQNVVLHIRSEDGTLRWNPVTVTFGPGNYHRMVQRITCN